MKNYYTISFVSMSIGWIGIILTHIVWSVINYNEASSGGTGLVLLWSGIFTLYFYLQFVVLFRGFIKTQLERRTFTEYSIGTAILSLFLFTFLGGCLFIGSGFHIVFLDAFVGGLIFGITFWWIWNKKGLNLNSTSTKIIGYSIPILFLGIYLKLLPNSFPVFVYNYVPQSIQNEIELRTLSSVKIGDSIEEIRQKLPGFFPYNECKGSQAKQYEEHEFKLLWNCCKVIEIEIGERGMIIGTIDEEKLLDPCE